MLSWRSGGVERFSRRSCRLCVKCVLHRNLGQYFIDITRSFGDIRGDGGGLLAAGGCHPFQWIVSAIFVRSGLNRHGRIDRFGRDRQIY